MFENISNDLHALIKNDPDGAVSIRELFVAQIFSLSLKQVKYGEFLNFFQINFDYGILHIT